MTWTSKETARVAAIEASVAALTARVAALEAPVPPPTGVVRPFPGTGSNTPAAFIAMMRDMTLDVIEIAAGTYTGWNLNVKDLSRAARPLTIRPAGAVIFDGGGMSSGLLYLNTLVGAGTPTIPVEDITFTGPFTVRNYALGATGLVLTGWVKRVTLNGFIVRNVTGSGNTSHALYVNSDEAHRSSAITANGWDVLCSNRTISALQTYHEPQVDGLTAIGWKVAGCHRATYLYHNATGITVDGWTIADCNATIDAEGVATGVVKNCTATNSGPLAKGQGYWLAAGILDGGGNIA